MGVWRSSSFISKGRQLSNIAVKSMNELGCHRALSGTPESAELAGPGGICLAGLAAPLRDHDIATASVRLCVQNPFAVARNR